MWVPVAVWQPCELLYTCYLLTYLTAGNVLCDGQAIWSRWTTTIRWAVGWWCCRRPTSYSTWNCTVLSNPSRCSLGNVSASPTWWRAPDATGTTPSAYTTPVRVDFVMISLDDTLQWLGFPASHGSCALVKIPVNWKKNRARWSPELGCWSRKRLVAQSTKYLTIVLG